MSSRSTLRFEAIATHGEHARHTSGHRTSSGPALVIAMPRSVRRQPQHPDGAVRLGWNVRAICSRMRS